MKLSEQQIKLIIETFEELAEELSNQSKGTLLTEQWDVLEYLKGVQKRNTQCPNCNSSDIYKYSCGNMEGSARCHKCKKEYNLDPNDD